MFFGELSWQGFCYINFIAYFSDPEKKTLKFCVVLNFLASLNNYLQVPRKLLELLCILTTFQGSLTFV
jgi:hypothetical protein